MTQAKFHVYGVSHTFQLEIKHGNISNNLITHFLIQYSRFIFVIIINISPELYCF